MDSNNLIEILINEEDVQNFKRLDAFLADKFSSFSRTTIKRLFEEGSFFSDQKIELKKMPKVNTLIKFNEPEIKDTEIIPQDIPLDILFEDDDLIVINKQAGLVIHPAPGNYDGTLVNAILFHCPDLKGIGHERRPGIVHRLDKGTTGVMVVAKSQAAHEGLVKLFSSHDINRKYQALAYGHKIESDITIKSLITRNPNNRLKMTSRTEVGKDAITHLKVLKYFEKFSHVELKLETGRTHQIRVHLSEQLNSPIINDRTYGKIKQESFFLPDKVKTLIKDYEHPFLHAKTLGFVHPITKKEMLFEAKPPKLYQDILDIFENEI
jgi:23S rRNA pseudouridine1911/1915/1917 synthase